MAKRALKIGWKVEVWSWSGSLSNKWKRLLSDQGGDISVHELDPFYFSVTFVKAGAFLQKDGSTVYVADRRVSRLPPGLKVKRA